MSAQAGSSPKRRTGVVTGCYARSGGALRIIEAGKCKPATEKTLSWQAGAVQLRGDIALAERDQILLEKDGIALMLHCTGLPQHPFAALTAHTDVQANLTTTFVIGADDGPASQPQIFPKSVLGDAELTAVSQAFAGLTRNEGQIVIDTGTHVISVVYDLVADDHDVAGGFVDRCRVTGTATLT